MRPTATRRSLSALKDTVLTRKHRPDYILLILAAALLAIGVILVYSISPALVVEKGVSGNYFVTRQVIAIGLGVVIFAITSNIPLSFWRKMYMPMLVIAACATAVALLLPVNPQYPAHRWIRLGALSFQSVELLKFALLMWLSSFLSLRLQRGTIGDFRDTLKPILGVLVGMGIVVAGIQSDLGSTGVIIAMMGTMAFVAGLPMKRIILIGLIIVCGLFLAISTTPYRRARLQAYLNPETSCMTTGYQACQALVAVGSGGIIGLGLGKSVQAYGYLPEAENDSIFAVYAEKFGFFGAILLLALFVAFFSRLKKIAEHAPDDHSRLLVIGILAWLSVQSAINIGAMIGLLPLKGITLPLISYGGSSVLLVMAALGVVFQISRYTSARVGLESGSTGGNNENSAYGRRFRGAYNSRLGSRA